MVCNVFSLLGFGLDIALHVRCHTHALYSTDVHHFTHICSGIRGRGQIPPMGKTSLSAAFLRAIINSLELHYFPDSKSRHCPICPDPGVSGWLPQETPTTLNPNPTSPPSTQCLQDSNRVLFTAAGISNVHLITAPSKKK